ncbi:CYTH domain-containing protein [Spongiivirga citrea]|uniref:CYTH domain-containing protein n=1 Tax=Spongiivirga citrea TaxID=1481457 RepID=A0A6M0CP29_9FLAO|nr:CYTH domain-containing protein [Spongiivirga citrea]NER17237.1 CYTH domain-containing protein [Spongiivirga citrea]
MSLEIERKFLVNSEAFIKEASSKVRIVQGFLTKDPNRVVRIRIKGDEGFITIKGISNENGTTRFEWEKKIPINDAESLLKLCLPGIIDKTRYEIPIWKHLYEVDVFEGDNEGLVIAEVELENENDSFQKPKWLGKEVTGDSKYYNSQLSEHPYKNW